MIERIPAVELHQQPGSAVKLQLVGLVAARDVFVGVAGKCWRYRFTAADLIGLLQMRLDRFCGLDQI